MKRANLKAWIKSAFPTEWASALLKLLRLEQNGRVAK